MITTPRFPHTRYLMQSEGSRIVKSVNYHTGIETVYPARKSVRRFVGLAFMGAAGVSAMVVIALRVWA